MKTISGGVAAPIGFTANGMHCGIRKNKTKNDIALIYSEKRAVTAAVYTTNRVKGAPLVVTKNNLSDGYAQAIVCNSGNANTCNSCGVAVAEETCRIFGGVLDIPASDVVVASTGVIGQPMDIAPIADCASRLAAGLNKEGSDDAVSGIMTTDTVKKQIAVEFSVGGKTCRIGAIAKGSGMIHPNMATMLVFITTDAVISRDMLQKALSSDIQNTFNMVSVDGDTSTNDMVVVMANGMSGAAEITREGEEFSEFCKALNSVTVSLCKSIAGDGEGATKLIECTVSGAPSEAAAKISAKAVICSSLVKAAMFGADANWGRVLCAVGYSGADAETEKASVSFRSAAGTVEVCRGGFGCEFSEDEAKKVLSEGEIEILVDLGAGKFTATAWGCDLTYDYVKINGDYRT